MHNERTHLREVNLTGDTCGVPMPMYTPVQSDIVPKQSLQGRLVVLTNGQGVPD